MSGPNLTRRQIADLYFMEHRAKVLDIAAFLDRADRAGPASGTGAGADGEEDPRYSTLGRALALLIDGKGERARRVLEMMSDPTLGPIAKAGGKGAIGVWPGGPGEKPR